MQNGQLDKTSTAFLIIDVQERLMPVIQERKRTISFVNKLIKGAQILDVPLLVTEQYPKGLGHTDADIELPAGQVVIEKNCFSCMLSEQLRPHLKGKKSLVLAGVEAHICVLKTALDAAAAGYEVHVVADAVSSRSAHNKMLAINRMRQSNIYVVSTEMVLFMLMDEAGNDTFKAISNLIK